MQATSSIQIALPRAGPSSTRRARSKPSASVLSSVPGSPARVRLHRSSLASASSRSATMKSRSGVLVRAAVSPPGAPSATAKPKVERTDIRTSTLAPHIQQLRCVVKERLQLEIEFNLDRGTSDNCFIIKGEKATALIDVPDNSFATAFGQSLKKAAPAPRSFQFIVLGHFSPRRADALAAAIAARPLSMPPVEIWCTNPAAQTIYNLLKNPPDQGGSEALQKAFKIPGGGIRARLRTVRGGDVLSLGYGHDLRFILTPTPRWPDEMCVYDPASLLLFSSKLFSAHVGEPEAASGVPADFDDGGWEKYGKDWGWFYECMFAPVAKQTAAALDKLDVDVVPMGPVLSEVPKPNPLARGVGKVVRALFPELAEKLVAPPGGAAPADKLQVSVICPLHGPIIRTSTSEVLREYREWTRKQLEATRNGSIAVIYASAYGNTAALAQAIARGATKAGVAVESLNCEFSTPEEVSELIRRTDGFTIGSPTLGGHMPTPVKTALGAILREPGARAKPCGVFGSFGWSGEAVDELEGRLKDGGLSFAFETIRCKMKPTEATLQVCEESGTDLAQEVLKQVRKKAREAAKAVVSDSDKGTAQAVGKIVGSLCVVSAKKGDAESAMLASWVSQASFNPPGLTVAVKKERAIESLVQQGGKFTLNVLAEGKEKTVFKALSKEFAPGESRFGDLETQVSETNGCTILPSVAVSYLDCTVKDRMEAGDHWIILATVDNGKLLDEKSLTAVHHRKSGTTY